MSSRDLEELIQITLDGTASEGDSLELQEILRSDREARKLYWQYACMHQSLDYRFSRTTLVSGRQSKKAGNILRFQRRRLVVASLAVACAAVVVFGLAQWLLPTPESTPVVTYKVSPQSLIEVSASSGKITRDAKLDAGSKVTVKQGVIELNFIGGSRAVVQGPAEFEILGPTAMRLKSGRAWCRISAKDRGFQLTSRELQVVDLGTEFGVIADPLGHDEVHVFGGSVETGANTVSAQKITLTEGHSRRANPIGQMVEVESDPEAFLHELPIGIPFLYFSFDELEGERTPVLGSYPGADQIDARLVRGSGNPELVPGVSGKALSLSGKSDHVITSWPGFSGISPRTVTFWLKVDPKTNLSMLPNVVGWGDDRAPGGKWKNMLEQKAPGAGAYPRISFNEYAYDAPSAVNDGKWHHLAMSYSGKLKDNGHPDVAIFIDGVSQTLTYRDFYADPDAAKLPQTRTSFGAKPLGIGSVIDESPTTFAGQIDELRIYAGVLPEEEIRREANRN